MPRLEFNYARFEGSRSYPGLVLVRQDTWMRDGKENQTMARAVGVWGGGFLNQRFLHFNRARELHPRASNEQEMSLDGLINTSTDVQSVKIG